MLFINTFITWEPVKNDLQLRVFLSTHRLYWGRTRENRVEGWVKTREAGDGGMEGGVEPFWGLTRPETRSRGLLE